MKKLLLTSILASATTITFAQSVNFGIKAGINFSTERYAVSDPGLTMGSKTGFHVGVIADLSIQQFSIQPGLYFITKGGTDTYQGSYTNTPNSDFKQQSSTKLNYLELPVNLLYHLKITPELNVFFGAGPYLGYGLSGKFHTTYSGYMQGTVDYNLSFRENQLAGYKNPDFGANFMIGERLKHFTLDVNYSLGLVNVYNLGPQSKIEIRALGVSAGYMFK